MEEFRQGLARRLWAHTGWARLGRIAQAIERLEAAPSAPPDRLGIALYRRMGLTLLLDGSSTVDRGIITEGAWEAAQVAKLRELAFEAVTKARGPKVFLDIGAYFGLYALLFDRERWFDQVIAYEPDQVNFAELEAELFLNGASRRIQARNVALGESAGSVRLFRSDRHPEGNRGGIGSWGQGDVNSASARVVTIDEEISVRAGVVIAKIDVEGAQDRVLRGMRRTVGANRCVIQVEAFEPERAKTLALLAELHLEVVHAIGPDLFATSAP